MLNLDGEEDDRKKGTELSNKVTADLGKYKGLVKDFANEHRATLTFAIPKGSNSQQSSAHSSRNNSLERHPQPSRYFDHFKPNKVSWDDELDVILDMIEKYKKWMREIIRVSGPDPGYEWDSLMSLLDEQWTKRMNEDKTLKTKKQEDWFAKMTVIMIDRYPLVNRRIDHISLMKSKDEMPSAFMERVFSTMYSSQMDKAPPVARALVYITKSLRSEGIDKDVSLV